MTETYTINFHDLILTVKYIDKKWVSRESELEKEVEKLKKQNEIMREALSKVIKAADFYSSHADCKRDSWSCKCSYCKPNDHSINVSHAKKFLKDVEGDE